MFGCKKPPESAFENDLRKQKGNVVILNEGLFQWAQSELSLYNKNSKTVSNNIYKQYNNRKLGDVLQSITEWNNRLYLVINNSGKIEIIDNQTFLNIGTISGLKSPRKIVFYMDKKAYITDLYNNAITVYDLVQQSVMKKIPINGWTEDAIVIDDKLYVSSPKNEYVYIIDATQDILEDSIKTLYGGQSFQMDAQGYLWEACMGDSTKGFFGGLMKFNIKNRTLDKGIVFNNKKETASYLCSSLDRNSFYFINKNIYKIDLNQYTISQVFDGSNKQLYGLNIDIENNELYIADAKDFLSSGDVYRFDLTKQVVVDQFKVGMIPNGFLFLK